MLLPFLIRLRAYPHIFFVRSGHKIYEFNECTRNVNFLPSDIVLDVGCGTGTQTFCIGKKCSHIVGLDVSANNIAFAEARGLKLRGRISSEFICSKLENANFPDNHFDKIISVCVIEHISNYEEVIGEIYRILKPGGTFVFSVDSLTTIESPELLAKHKVDNFVEKYFSAKELNVLLDKNNFKNKTICPILRSEYAKKLFIKGIDTQFKLRQTFFIDYLKLRYNERRTMSKQGLFLVCKCSK
jgi:ubiquinone/menaquinone biosynthesis C-methylase UbiE